MGKGEFDLNKGEIHTGRVNFLMGNPVVKSAKESIIYCFYEYITINGKRQSCPPYPSVLPFSVPFSLEKVEHLVRIETLTTRDRSVSFSTPHFELDPHNNDFNVLARALREKNDRSLSIGGITATKEVVAFPATAFWLSAIGCICTAISGGYSLFRCCQFLNGGREASGSHEHINVISNIDTTPKREDQVVDGSLEKTKAPPRPDHASKGSSTSTMRTLFDSSFNIIRSQGERPALKPYTGNVCYITCVQVQHGLPMTGQSGPENQYSEPSA